MRRTRPWSTLATAFLAASAGCAGAPRLPNVVLVVLDTVRADRISCYGYPRPTTPRIDALCARGIRFADASSTSTWTLPAHASIFTGRYPIEHGATQEHTRLDPGLPTLAEILGEHGYATFGISANPLVSRSNGFARGFAGFAETWRARAPAGGAGLARHPNLVAAQRFLEQTPGPFFLFVNFIEAHGPYEPREPQRSRFLSPRANPALVRSAQGKSAATFYLDPSSISSAEFALLSDLYDGEIATVDALVGELVDLLTDTGRLSNTLLIVTSDHGENLGDHHHYRHVFSLYGTTVHVPLIVLPPGGVPEAQVRTDPVSLVDLFPTILSQARIAAPAAAGRDLLAAPDRDGDRPIFAEYYYPLQALELFDPAVLTAPSNPLTPYLRRLRSVEQGGMRLIWSSDGRRELFNRDADPGERQNLAAAPWAAERERRLEAALAKFVGHADELHPLPRPAPGAAPATSLGDVDAESRERLRELGYLR